MYFVCNCICILIACIVCSMCLYCFCNFVCCVLFECGVLFCVLCLTVVPMPPGTNPFAVKINNKINTTRTRLGSNRGLSGERLATYEYLCRVTRSREPG
jgi:hypothetical protein